MNHLIIGLGGTGGRAIRSFRKAMYQSFRRLQVDGVNLDYLYVDSDDRMMGLDDPSWKILGQSVQLDPKNQVLIKAADLRACLNNLSNYPNLRPWLGSSEQWQDILGGIADATIGGQKRRLGRFLFARGAADFASKLSRLVSDLQGAGGTHTTFHIICGLAGGTGSGSVIDTITQIRKTYPAGIGREYPLLVYALLPDRVPKEGWNTGNYWANGYAALMELNALSVEAWQPTDISSGNGDRVKRGKSFDGCYVFSNENGRVTVDVQDEVPDIVASFLYQKIVVARDNEWQQSLGRIECCENGDSSPETAPESREPQRSRYFLTFGVKRLAYPEEEIQEYITYSFGLQAANQLRFNNWVDNIGYAAQPRNQAFAGQVKAKELLEKWKLSDEHLLLSRGILPEDAANKSWKLLHNEWHDLAPPYRQAVVSGTNRHWVNEIKTLFERRHQKDFRRVGVGEFYRSRLAAKSQHSAEIRGVIEMQLFSDWSNGERSMHDTSELLAALVTEIGQRKLGYESRSSDLSGEIERLNSDIQANDVAWAQLGPLSRALGRHHNVLDAQAGKLADYYERLTLREAYEFAKQVLVQLVQDLNELKAHVDKLAARISQVTEEYTKKIEQRLRERRQQPNGQSSQPDGHEQIVRFYDPVLVVKLTDAMTRDAAIQQTATAEVRRAILLQLGEKRNFPHLDEFVTLGTLRDTIDRTCLDLARTTHEKVVKSEQQRVLGVNIVNKLRERYEGDEESLRRYVKDLMDHAENYLVINRDEIDRNMPGVPGNRQPLPNTTVILPATENSQFGQTLATVLRNFAPGGGAAIVTSENKRNEIVIVSLLNLFPLRYSKLVGDLAEKYRERLRGSDAARVRLEIHTEGDGTSLPALFLPSDEAVVRDSLPYVLLGQAMGLIEETPNAGGSMEWALLRKDEYGMDSDPVFIGKKISEAPSRLTDVAVLGMLRREVQQRLQSGVYRRDDARENLSKAVVNGVESVKTERGGDLNDDVFRNFRDAGRRAIDLVKQGA